MLDPADCAPDETQGVYTPGKRYQITSLDEGGTGDMIGLIDDRNEQSWAVWEHFTLAK